VNKKGDRLIKREMSTGYLYCHNVGLEVRRRRGEGERNIRGRGKENERGGGVLITLIGKAAVGCLFGRLVTGNSCSKKHEREGDLGWTVAVGSTREKR